MYFPCICPPNFFLPYPCDALFAPTTFEPTRILKVYQEYLEAPSQENSSKLTLPMKPKFWYLGKFFYSSNRLEHPQILEAPGHEILRFCIYGAWGGGGIITPKVSVVLTTQKQACQKVLTHQVTKSFWTFQAGLNFPNVEAPAPENWSGKDFPKQISQTLASSP